ncbi:MAG: type II toxin-antitoxin system VapC family toxin [bacterium]|nr:type II toxin-antitoxin system VapC family toxin [bacterium]
MLLLDTYAAIWAATADPSLRRGARKAIADAARGGSLYLSPITAWEIATLVRRGRLELTVSPRAFVDRLFGRPGVVEAPIDREIALLAGSLPGDFRGDPADRLIVATAIVRGCRVVTRDERILAYAKRTGALPALAC